MTYSEFIDAVTAKVNATEDGKKVTKAIVKEVVPATTEVVKDVVKAGDKITLAGFGTFEGSKRAARDGRNPITGATIKIPASTVPKFKAAKAFKEYLK